MFKKIKELNIHLIIICLTIGIFLGLNLSFAKSAENNTLKYLDYFHFVYQTIKNQFVENKNAETIFQGAMKGMLDSLNDPYSRYLDKKKYAEFKEAVTGKFVGIGIEITVKNDQVIVIAPIEDAPAYKAGIITGDIILKVDDNIVKGTNLSDVIKKIKGKPNTKTTILIKRNGFPEPLKFVLERESIKVKSTKYGIIKEEKSLAYIKITHFFDTTAIEVEKALKFFNSKNINKLILDLRDNPGGNLEASINISDFFLPKNKIIVTTKGRKDSKVKDDFKSKTNSLYTGKLILLVNSGSASASEVLSGALQDNKRAKLVGQKTFGKALVQQLIDIDPGKTGFTLTIRKYYTPSGALIHKKGINPDYKIEQNLIPKADRKNLGRIINDGLLEEFTKTNKTYNSENTKKLITFLNEKKLPISDRVAAFYLKKQINRYKKRSLYDIEFDTELNKAIKIINERK